MLKPHRRSGVAIKVDDQDDTKYAVQVGILRKMRVLESFAELAVDRFTRPAPFSTEARACASPNATSNRGTRTVILCYELVEEFSRTFQRYSRKASK